MIDDFRSDPGAGQTIDGFRRRQSPLNVPTVTNIQSEDTDEDVFAILQPSNDPKSLGRIGEYEVSRELGRGGMGVVFDAFDPVLHRRVAIKVLAPFLASSKRSRQRFLREARASAAIRHPNVVTIHAVNPQAALPYLVMEYVPGRTLRDRIRLGSMGLTTMLRIANQLAAGLAAAHGEGVIHRDVKPGNILLEDGIERVKISDFGLAIVALDVEQLSSADRPVGTPAYMSPEQVSGGKVDARSDLFGLGCVFYAMAAGSSPFQGANSLDIARRVTDFHPRPLHEVNPNVPHFYSDIVMRLLEKDPAARFQSAKELQEVLQEYLSAANLGGSDELAMPLPPPVAISPPEPLPKPRGKKWLPFAISGMAAAIIISILLAWHPWRKGEPEPLLGGSPPPARTSGLITVSKVGDADFTSIREAIAHAESGSVIRVLDGSTYDESIVLKSSISDLTIEAPTRATLENSKGGSAVVSIESAANITLLGLQVRAKNRQHAVLVAGQCEGLTLEGIRAEVPPDSGFAAICLWLGARGQAERPIFIRDSEIHSGDIGLVLIGDAKPSRPSPIKHVRVEGCRFSGPGVQIALHDAIADVTLSRNRFVNGKAGVSAAVKTPKQLRQFTVTNNTFYRLDSWLAIDECALEQEQISIDRNLIVQCRQIRVGSAELAGADSWFRDNWWVKSEGLDEALAQKIATLKDLVPLVSEDPEHADFLRPEHGAFPLDVQIGALAPRKNPP